MKANLRALKKQRTFSDDFKREIVSLFESGKFSVLQLEKLYGIANAVIYNWIYKFSTFNEKGIRIVEMKTSSTNKVKELEQKIKQLEQIVGQKQIQIDFLEKMIDLAKDELDIDVKKNYSTPPSSGSASTVKTGGLR
ncbi:transposase [Haoranjiania flava]|uniref:Transposase n=1 Tax=Haoranjiania flava TaxID=1856322 RepID=A0AAE3LLN2_9BACT|nr:transposase [Haoranjiania flava]MCU7695594.1 transposase [Haoranjiania flava]